MAKKQRLLIAINVNCKCGIILDYNGEDVHRELEQTSIWLEDFGFDESDVPGAGIWIWEGYIKYTVDSHSKEYDAELLGSWRRLTINELKILNEKGSLWSYLIHKDSPLDN